MAEAAEVDSAEEETEDTKNIVPKVIETLSEQSLRVFFCCNALEFLGL